MAPTLSCVAMFAVEYYDACHAGYVFRIPGSLTHISWVNWCACVCVVFTDMQPHRRTHAQHIVIFHSDRTQRENASRCYAFRMLCLQLIMYLTSCVLSNCDRDRLVFLCKSSCSTVAVARDEQDYMFTVYIKMCPLSNDTITPVRILNSITSSSARCICSFVCFRHACV